MLDLEAVVSELKVTLYTTDVDVSRIGLMSEAGDRLNKWIV